MIFLLVSLKATLVLLAAAGLCRVLRRAPAATLHLVWVLAFGGLLVLPLLSLLLPALPIPLLSLWPGEGSTSVVASQVFRVSNAAAPGQGAPVNWIVLAWLQGACVSCLPALLGTISVWRISRRANPLASSIRGVELFTAGGEIMPMVWGLRRPVVLLPASAVNWPAAKLRIVLLHELAHIERRDLRTQILSQLVVAIYWFHPLVWWASRQLRRQSEMACDDRVLEAGVKPSEYAAELLEVARSLAWRKTWAHAAFAMARPSNFEGRLLAILEPRPRSRRRMPMAGAALALAAVVVPAAALRFDNGEAKGAGVSGSIYDGSGGLVPGALVFLSSPRGTIQTESTNGAFAFDGVAPGAYGLEIRKPGFAPVVGNVRVAPNRRQRQDFFLELGSVQERLTVTGQGTPKPGPVRIRVGGNVQAAKLIQKIVPVYPRSAKMRRVSGQVLLRANIQKDGTPGDLAVLTSPDPELSDAALEAVRKWRYSTTLLNGEPAAVVTHIAINFTLLK